MQPLTEQEAITIISTQTINIYRLHNRILELEAELKTLKALIESKEGQ